MTLLGSLRYLVALDEHRHFGRAAQACHVRSTGRSRLPWLPISR
jgi:DNA-binding transcriptional LysR family regulator